jgi:transposase
MITMDMLGKVRRMRMRDKLSISEIAKRTGLARNTVRGWLSAPGDVIPKYERRSDTCKITDYEVSLIMALKADSLRHKDSRRTARALFVQIAAQGYQGGYSRVTDFIRAWRAQAGKGSKAFVPLAFERGEAFQFDWSEEGMLVGGVYYKMQISHMKLCFSRAFWLVAYPSQSHEMLFDAHTRSFTELGGVPRRGIYDNMKTAVDKVQKGKERVVNQRFKAMCSHYLFDADFCNVASGWEKGIVEKNVQDSRRRIWIEAGERRQSVGHSSQCSCTMCTARARTLGEKVFCFSMTRFFQKIKLLQNPVRFNSLQHSDSMLVLHFNFELNQYRINRVVMILLKH